MGFINNFKLTRNAFSVENEVELAYLYGQKLTEIEYMKLKKPRLSGFLLRSFIFFAKLAISFTLRLKSSKTKDILIYVGSTNQFNSIEPIIDALKNKKTDFFLSYSQGIFEKNRSPYTNSRLVGFGFNIVLMALSFYLIRGLPLYIQFKKEKRNKELNWHFNHFLDAYAFVPYFIELLTEVRPSLVVVANDHTVNNRCLRLAAELMGIETLYVQHASVTSNFPPLEFDYALLDGRTAHDIYLNNYKDRKEENPRVDVNIANCQVFLSGQKKRVVSRLPVSQSKKNWIGVAVNTLDDFNSVRDILDVLFLMGKKCILRTHPIQNKIFINHLKSFIKDKDWIVWSDSNKEGLSQYFFSISSLISGNTSIHLEAALSGLPTFYYEMSQDVVRPDYYGYVKNGISYKIKDGFSLSEFELLSKNAESSLRNNSIKRYSETFNTPFQNNEGKLSAEIIIRILNKQTLEDLFTEELSTSFKSVYSLKL